MRTCIHGTLEDGVYCPRCFADSYMKHHAGRPVPEAEPVEDSRPELSGDPCDHRLGKTMDCGLCFPVSGRQSAIQRGAGVSDTPVLPTGIASSTKPLRSSFAFGPLPDGVDKRRIEVTTLLGKDTLWWEFGPDGDCIGTSEGAGEPPTGMVKEDRVTWLEFSETKLYVQSVNIRDYGDFDYQDEPTSAERLAEIEHSTGLAHTALKDFLTGNAHRISAAMVRRVLTVGSEYDNRSYDLDRDELRKEIVEELADALFYVLLSITHKERNAERMTDAEADELRAKWKREYGAQ